MSFEVGFYCDKCGTGYVSEYESIPSLHKYIILSKIRKHGFSVGKRILYPNCKRGGKKRD